jgi:hypothetical protein
MPVVGVSTPLPKVVTVAENRSNMLANVAISGVFTVTNQLSSEPIWTSARAISRKSFRPAKSELSRGG